MSDDKMGGPAFPGEQGIGPEGEWNQTFNRGMTLWDYYAAHASEKDVDDMLMALGDLARSIDNPRQVARAMCADAMLAERAKREKGDE